MTVVPITPDEINVSYCVIPEKVIAVWNEMIAKHYNGREAVILQRDILNKLMELGTTRKVVMESCWLDVEDLYEKYGWQVVYGKPGWVENYDARFTFTKKVK